MNDTTQAGKSTAVEATPPVIEVQGPLERFGPKLTVVSARDFFTEPAQGVLTSEYGERWGRNHSGIDIGGEDGSNILAADGGTISFAGWVEGYGNYLSIDHGNGFETAYAHCSELLVAQGEVVSQGQVIAYMGNTGNSTGPHLHFEVKREGVFQDPLDYVLYEKAF
ncbi:MAG: M23 family metallopeptidase [Clostridia bacterium]|nr:M23 family metallopeptidase [Clostridia bacterium]